jgi:CTP synthase
LFCNVDEEAVITAKDVDNIYEVPLLLAGEGLDKSILKMLELPDTEKDLGEWEQLVHKIKNPQGEVTIGMVGKYVRLEDSYKSLNEALAHGGFAHNLKVNLQWIEAEDLATDSLSPLEEVDAILVPGGFGPRGTEGMALAAGYCRRERVPYFGICYGFQWSVVEYARSVCGLADAGSAECENDYSHQLIVKLKDLVDVEEMGGTMRLGAYPCILEPGSLAHQAYGTLEISERHRHRFEFNCEYEEMLIKGGLRISGRTPDAKFVEIVEIPDHPWFLAVQFHPEFKSRPLAPHPLFRDFIAATWKHKQARESAGGGTGEQTAQEMARRH